MQTDIPARRGALRGRGASTFRKGGASQEMYKLYIPQFYIPFILGICIIHSAMGVHLETGNTILYSSILYYTILCYTILCYTILCYATLYYTMLYYAMLCYAMLYYTMLCYTILLLLLSRTDQPRPSGGRSGPGRAPRLSLFLSLSLSLSLYIYIYIYISLSLYIQP